MALEGTIKEFGLADILQLIGLQKKTGVLILQREDEAVNISFEDGSVVMAEESVRSERYLTGAILARRKKITSGQLTEALEIQKNTRQKIGSVLVGQGHITKDELREVLAFQMKQIIYAVFRWTGGDYKFSQVRVDYDRDTIIPLSSEHILMDGVRMLDEWPIIKSKLPSYDIVLKKNEEMPKLDEEEEKDIFAGPDDEGGEGGLSEDAQSLLDLVDGSRNVNEILDSSRLGEFDTCRTLLDLMDGGYISRSDEIKHVPAEKATKAPMKAGKINTMRLGWLAYVMLAIAPALLFLQLNEVNHLIHDRDVQFEGLKKPLAMLSLKKVYSNTMLYYLDHGHYPDSTAVMEHDGYIDADDAHDPWGAPFFVRVNDRGDIAVVSAGPDRVLNSGDDLVSGNTY